MVEGTATLWFMSRAGKLLLVRGLDFAVSRATSNLEDRRCKRQVVEEVQRDIEAAAQRHANYVNNWSETHKPAGHPSLLPVDESTVPLDFTATPRRYAPLRAPQRSYAESDLLALGYPLLLTGDPGAGKTTTIQRLCRHLISQPPVGMDEPNYPVVVECRSRNWSHETLADVLYEATGFPRTDGNRLAAVAEFLNLTGAFVFVDGLDEVTYRAGRERRERLENEVRELGNHLRDARIMVSCRSGSAPELRNYESLELCPFTPDQIEAVVRSRLGDRTPGFLEELAASPIEDVASRPLLLSKLVTVYELRGGQMPTRPHVLYEMIVTLLLEKWDEQRAVRRSSKYARFGAAEKKRFLAELSYRLTLGSRIEFSTDDLVDVYEDICGKHDLPRQQARQVAREIESHSGLIVHSSDKYAFSHLSLQEYLCADHIVRAGLDAELLGVYIDRYPDPVAVAVAMASEPNRWMWQVIWKRNAFQKRDAVRAFVHRLGQETPAFRADTDLGHSVLRLMFVADDVDAFAPLAPVPAVRESVAEAVGQYVHRKAPGGVSLKYDGPKRAGRDFTPRQGAVSSELWNLMLPNVKPRFATEPQTR